MRRDRPELIAAIAVLACSMLEGPLTWAEPKHVLSKIPDTSTRPSPAVPVLPHSNASPSPSLSVQPASGNEVPKSLPSLTPLQSQQLLKEFNQALKTELKALEHRQKFEIKELKASQAARLKEWQNQANADRRKFFAEHPHGPDRRAYVQDLMERRKVFTALLKEEEKQRAQEQSVRYHSLKTDQIGRIKEFKDALNRNEVPPNRLWPQPGR